MLETALLSSNGFRSRRARTLPVAIAAHAAVVAVFLGAWLFQDEDLAEPPTPIVPVQLSGPPPAARAPSGSPQPRRRALGKRERVPLLADSVEARNTIPTGASEPPLQESGEIEEAETNPGGGEGVPGGTGKGPGGIGTRGETAEVLPIGGDVVAPVLVHRVDPAYPEWARRIRLEGLLILQAVIGTGGEVQELTVLKSAHPALDAAARDAVHQWRYRPATLNGRLVRVFLTVTVEFRLR
jgi:protein TonB